MSKKRHNKIICFELHKHLCEIFVDEKGENENNTPSTMNILKFNSLIPLLWQTTIIVKIDYTIFTWAIFLQRFSFVREAIK